MKTVKKDTDYFNPFLDMDGGAMGVKDRQNAKYFTERAKNRLAMKKGKKRAIKPSLDSARQQSRILEMLD